MKTQKKALFFMLILILMTFVSCAESETPDLTCNTECKSWETCKEGKCVLKDDQCTTDNHCPNSSCNLETHTCNPVLECPFGEKSETACVPNMNAIENLGETTGTYPNDILLLDNALFIVNSGDNAIQKITLADKTNTNPFISLPEGSNPYYFTIQNEELFVTNLMANTYSRAKLSTPETVETITLGADELKGPEGIAVNDSHIFITNVNSGWDADANKMAFGEGFLTLINKADNTFIKKVTTTQKNPQKTFIYQDKLYVINSGTTEFDANYVSYPSSNAGIDVLDLNDMEGDLSNTAIPFIDGKTSGNPANYAIDETNNMLYLASGSAPELYAYSFENNQMVKSTDQPIVIDTFATPTSSLLNVVLVDSYLFVTNFNNDHLYIVDTKNNDKVIMKLDISDDTDQLEGAQGMAYDKVERKLYIFFGMSKRLISIDLNVL